MKLTNYLNDGKHPVIRAVLAILQMKLSQGIDGVGIDFSTSSSCYYLTADNNNNYNHKYCIISIEYDRGIVIEVSFYTATIDGIRVDKQTEKEVLTYDNDEFVFAADAVINLIKKLTFKK